MIDEEEHEADGEADGRPNNNGPHLTERGLGSAGKVVMEIARMTEQASRALIPVGVWFVLIFAGLLVLVIILSGPLNALFELAGKENESLVWGLLFLGLCVIGVSVYVKVATSQPTRPRPARDRSGQTRIHHGLSEADPLQLLAAAASDSRAEVVTANLPRNARGLRWRPLLMQQSMGQAQGLGLSCQQWVEHHFSQEEQRMLDLERVYSTWQLVQGGDWDAKLSGPPLRIWRLGRP